MSWRTPAIGQGFSPAGQTTTRVRKCGISARAYPHCIASWPDLRRRYAN